MNPKISLSVKLLLILLLTFSFQLLTFNSFSQNIGINTTGSEPNEKALLDIDASPSNDKGLLVPRLTTIERDAIAEPIPESLLIYNTTTHCFEAWFSPNWVAFGCIGCEDHYIDAGADIVLPCGVNYATLAANTPTEGYGEWTVVSGIATITNPSSPTSTVTGLAIPGTVTLRWTISNPHCSSTDDVVITTCLFTCGDPLVISHTAGTVAAVTKLVNYGTIISSLSGSSKCWITQNLGSTHQASSATDATEASAGWYWQFNRKQGFKHDGTTRTPDWTWDITTDNSITWEASKDPCTIELGACWRIPTKTEWENVVANGSWGNYNDTYNSELKIHLAGYLGNSDGTCWYRGVHGGYWGSEQMCVGLGCEDYGATLWFQVDNNNCVVNSNVKDAAFPLRCLKD
ncbi:MAG: hypothetical protein C0596_19180 [Marinilabiliales bacterium]|nr:MAG: hypothetical protein C0596_19180 [Marinilabiliales bacterium]